MRVTDSDVETVEILVDLNAVLDGRRVEREFTEISLRPSTVTTVLSGSHEVTAARGGRACSRERASRRHNDARSRRGQGSGPPATRSHAGSRSCKGVRLGDNPEDIHQLALRRADLVPY